MSVELPKPAAAQRFETLFDQAPFSVQLLAPDGRTLRVNRAWERLWQVPGNPSIKDYVLAEYNMLADPQLEAKGVLKELRRAFAGEAVELPLILYDPHELGRIGQRRWVKANAHPLNDADGNVTEVMLIHEDVTSQIEAEHALRLSESRLKQLANTIPQLAWIADPDGAIHWYNDRWYEYTGKTFDEMQGWGWQSVHDVHALPSVVERWKHSLATGEPFQMTFPLKGRDGAFRPFFTLVAPLKDASGSVVQWFGTNTDVSALHEAERNLRQAEERLRLATHAGHVGIWDWDVRRDVVSWSDEVFQLHGLECGPKAIDAQAFWALVHPDDVDRVRSAIDAAVRGTEDVFAAEFRTLLPGGGARWLSSWARVHRNPAGEAERIVGTTISIDAYKTAEAELRASDRRKDEFLAMLAHELRNPLAPISTAALLLQMNAGTDGAVRRASEIISRQVKHITELVDDLLDVSRVTRGLIKLDRAAVDLRTVVGHAVEQARPAIEARRHTLSVALGSAQATVLGDTTRLVQAIVNLLNNAAKYTPDGGRIELRVEADDGHWRLTVTDDGSGIEPALLPHVFDLFTQGNRNPGRSEGGLGIGLALVRSIVQQHGGQVQARSGGKGHGSTFTLVLPRHDGEVQPPPPDPDPAGRPARPLQVMVVDDNHDASRSLAQLLRTDGHQVVVRHDGKSALDAIGEITPEVFILDIGLPDIDGYELARRLRERAGSALFIALTGYGQAQDYAQSKAAGFDHHFLKPVDAARLARAMAAAV